MTSSTFGGFGILYRFCPHIIVFYFQRKSIFQYPFKAIFISDLLQGLTETHRMRNKL